MKLLNVIVVKYQTEPPSVPIKLNGITYDHWLNVDSREFRRWEDGKWKEVTK